VSKTTLFETVLEQIMKKTEEKEIGTQEILLIIGALMFGLAAIVFIYAFEPISDNERETTKNNCRNLILPASFVNKVSGRKHASLESAIYTTQYRSDVDPITVEEHFYNQLVPQGWKYTLSRESAGTYLYFDKGKFSIIIEHGPIGFSSNRLYSVSCRWGQSREGLIGELFAE
jgi:hypothetical protein